MITDQDVKALSGPDAKARANGDPDGGLTGTINDITIADPVTDKTPKAKGLTVADIANQVGQNKIAVNFVWTLVTGFLVMFMQAGFAIVETGLCRVKNANHTMMMNFMVYGVGMLAYLVDRLRHTGGRRRRQLPTWATRRCSVRSSSSLCSESLGACGARAASS